MIGVLILTLGRVGDGLLEEASMIMGKKPDHTIAMNADSNQSPEAIRENLKNVIASIGEVDGILILADIFGATHVNTACQLLEKGKIELVAGVNLPMLLRVLNYRHKALPELVELAVTGGKTGVMSTDNGAPRKASRK